MIRVLVACLLVSSAVLTAGASDERPNILFAIADDWGYHASILGEPVLKTPTFDELARTGVL